MPSRCASLNSGAVSLAGISRSKKLSISSWSVIHQRGKKVVSASSGNTTRLQLVLGGLAQQVEHALDDGGAAVGALDRPRAGPHRR